MKEPKAGSATAYPKAHFIDNNEPNLIKVIKQNPLATLVYCDDNGKVDISHIPFHFQQPLQVNDESCINQQILVAHISNHHPLAVQLNRQQVFQSLTESSKSTSIKLIFHGENDYISPNDIAFTHRHLNPVPSWNYVNVHIEGKVSVIGGAQQKLRQILDSSEYFEHLYTLLNSTSLTNTSLKNTAKDNTVKNDKVTNSTHGVKNSEEQSRWSPHSLSNKTIEQSIMPMLNAITFFKLTIKSCEGRFKLSQNKPRVVREDIAAQLRKRQKNGLADFIHEGL
jgi:transcriptional regulator